MIHLNVSFSYRVLSVEYNVVIAGKMYDAVMLRYEDEYGLLPIGVREYEFVLMPHDAVDYSLLSVRVGDLTRVGFRLTKDSCDVNDRYTIIHEQVLHAWMPYATSTRQ